jgi:hypothetical protein
VLVSLGELVQPLRRSYWERSVPIVERPLSPSHCLVVQSDQVGAYHLRRVEGWADYAAIRQAFESRPAQRVVEGRKTGPLPTELVFGPPRLVIRDRDRPLECTVVPDPVYPQRAWVGLVDPELGPEWPYVVAGILNSTIGRFQYERLAVERPGHGRDIRKALLSAVRVPYADYDLEAFSRAATLSYRLHILYAASREFSLPAEIVDVTIPNHWIQLLSELARLYGFSETESRQLIEALRESPRDVPGSQAELYYVPVSPLSDVGLLGPADLERYEDLKAMGRRGTLRATAERELSRLQALLEYEDRVNRPITATAPYRWPGVESEGDALRVAECYLSAHRGQAYYASEPRRVDRRVWEVSVFYSPRPRGAAPTLTGKLQIDAVSGAVSAAG